MHASMKKLTALLLAGLMLLSLPSCAEEEETVGEGVTTDTDTTVEEESRDPNYVCDLPADLNYGDTTVGILYPGDGAFDRGEEIFSEKITGDVISDAVFERNTIVENQLKVKFEYIDKGTDSDVVSTINNYVQAGDRSAEIFSLGSYMCMGPTLSGCYLNLNHVENIDLDKFYWTQGYNDLMTIGDGMQFVASSPMAISTFRAGYLTIFNRDLMKDYNIPDIYDAVENGTWTLDYQYSLIKDIYVDADGDGVSSYGDFYGFSTGTMVLLDGYFVASDIHLLIHDEDGNRVFNSGTSEKIVNTVEKVSTLLNAPGSYAALGGGSTIQKITNKTCIIANAMFNDLEDNIESLADIQYGIAPLPKLNEDQKNYGTYIQDQVSSFGISASVGDGARQDMLGAVMEALAYHSNEIVRPAYYDSVLSLRFMQDPDSQNILNTMFESISFDYCFVVGLGGVREDLRVLLPSSNPSVASKIKSWETMIKTSLKGEQKKIDKLEK